MMLGIAIASALMNPQLKGDNGLFELGLSVLFGTVATFFGRAFGRDRLGVWFLIAGAAVLLVLFAMQILWIFSMMILTASHEHIG